MFWKVFRLAPFSVLAFPPLALLLWLATLAAFVFSPVIAAISIVTGRNTVGGPLSYLTTHNATLDGGVDQGVAGYVAGLTGFRLWWQRTCWVCRNPAYKLAALKPVTAGMSFTKAECESMLMARVTNDYYKPLTKCIADFTKKPISVQAAAISGAYNFGVAGMCGSRAAALIRNGKYREACEAQTAWNKAGGQVVNGLVKRREMGDAQRIGEAELCVSERLDRLYENQPRPTTRRSPN
jgi:GH24 family phage-related lysozyme (muramidase)